MAIPNDSTHSSSSTTTALTFINVPLVIVTLSPNSNFIEVETLKYQLSESLE
jgi:hypothetical protein